MPRGPHSDLSAGHLWSFDGPTTFAVAKHRWSTERNPTSDLHRGLLDRRYAGRYHRVVFPARERPWARAVADLVPVLARQFLTAPAPPARLPTVRELADQHDSSPSSIHFAIHRLKGAGAVTIEVRGPLGTYLISRSVGRLWTLAENGRPLVIALPLTSSPRYEALATAIKQILTRAEMEVFLIFVRGSRQRLQAVREGRCHLAAMSSFAASELCSPDDSVVVELPPLSTTPGTGCSIRRRGRTRTRCGSSSTAIRPTSNS